jgi:hypothetical protein
MVDRVCGRRGALSVALVGLLTLVGGCSGAPSPVVAPSAAHPAPALDGASGSGEQGEQGEARSVPSPLVVEGEGELAAGRGPERLAVTEDGVVRAGALRGEVEVPGASPAWRSRQASIEVVVLERARDLRAVLVLLPTADVKEPPNRAQLLLVDRDGDRLVRVLDLVLGIYGVTELEFPGDGSARYVEDGWTACAREDHPEAPVVREAVVFRLDDGGAMAEVERRPTELTQRCADLPSCPFEAVDSDGW